MPTILRTTGLVLAIALGASLACGQTAHTSPTFQAVYAIGGTITDIEGKPACNVRVCAIAEDFDESKPNVVIPCALSDAQGNFTIAQHGTGKFRIHYDAVEQGYWPSRRPFFGHPTIVPPEVVVEDRVSRGSTSVILPPRNGMLVGRALDAKTGLPLDWIEVTLCHAADPRVCAVNVVKSGDGKFKLPAPHVPFTVRARADGFNEWRGLRGEDQTELRIASGSTFRLDVLMTRQAGAIDRPINDAEKQPGLNLAAPTLLGPADGIKYDHYPRKTKVEWSPVAGAASYSLEVDYCQPSRQQETCAKAQPLQLPVNPPMKGVTGTSYEFNFVGAQPGRWRVWAVDKEGREGFKSPWWTFVYLK